MLLFDFDAAKSVNITGNGNGKIIFKPVIKLAVTENPGSLEITTSSLNNGEVGVPYTTSLNAMGGTAPYTCSISAGSLPDGLTIDANTDVISGTPSTAAVSNFTLKVEDAATTGKKSATKNFTIDIAAAGALQIINTSLPDGTDGVAYNSTVQVIGGTAPYSWTMTGNLPAGLTLNGTTGEISGTPTEKGVFNLTITVTDAANPANSDTQAFKLTIAKDAAE